MGRMSIHLSAIWKVTMVIRVGFDPAMSFTLQGMFHDFQAAVANGCHSCKDVCFEAAT